MFKYEAIIFKLYVRLRYCPVLPVTRIEYVWATCSYPRLYFCRECGKVPDAVTLVTRSQCKECIIFSDFNKL
jgi:hypothetical protein